MHTSLNRYFEAGYRPAWPVQSVPESITDSLEVSDYTSANYIPALIPGSHDWHVRIKQAFAESAYAFIADVWAEILSQKTPKEHVDSLYVLWNQQVPKPTPASALFWMFMCESWPITRPAYRSLFADSPNDPFVVEHNWFPPQPINLPISTPIDLANIQPCGWARNSFVLPSQKRLHPRLIMAATRQDRVMMNQMPHIAKQYYPPGYVSILEFCNTRKTLLQSGYDWESRHVEASSGLARGGVIEAQLHMDRLESLRKFVGDKTSLMSGIPTCYEATCDVPGLHLRHLSERINYTKPFDDTLMDFDILNSGTIQISELGTIGKVPAVLPPVWFGFAGEGLWVAENEGIADANKWVAAYVENRRHAITQFIKPDAIALRKLNSAEQVKRFNRIQKAAKATGGNPKVNAAIANAFQLFRSN